MSHGDPIETVRLVMNVAANAVLAMPRLLETATAIADVPFFFEGGEESEEFAREVLAIIGEETIGGVPLSHELQHVFHFASFYLLFLELHDSLFVDQKASACLVGLDGTIVFGEGEVGVVETPELAIVVGFVGSDGDPPVTDWHA